MDRAATTAPVKATLALEQVSGRTRIGVDTVQGPAPLTGIVETAALRTRAAEVAQRVQGVPGVVNNLRVQGTPS